MSNEDNALLLLREKIDSIDYKIHDLLNIRAQLALEIAEIKIKNAEDKATFYRPEREKQILKKITAYNKGPLSAEAIDRIFKTVINECRNLQIDQHSEDS